MNWVRKHIRHGSRLALFALLVQLVLTSGHIHLDIARAAPAHAAAASVQAPTDADQAPVHHHAGDYCDLCAVAAHARAVVLASPPLLHLPQVAIILQRVTEAEFDHLESVTGLPHPRGPPHA